MLDIDLMQCNADNSEFENTRILDGQVSESEVVVKNTALKWTMAWGFFCTILFVPAIYCLIESQNRTAQGGEIVPVWIGVVLLLFALLSCCMLLPFTVVSTTRMDKSSDLFVQHHGLLNCLPYSCIPSTEFPLSEIERIDVEDLAELFQRLVQLFGSVGVDRSFRFEEFPHGVSLAHWSISTLTAVIL